MAAAQPYLAPLWRDWAPSGRLFWSSRCAYDRAPQFLQRAGMKPSANKGQSYKRSRDA
jgi:hypothetical protein